LRNLVDGVDLKGTYACAAFSLRKTARAVTQVYDEALREAGLRSTQFTVLVAVAKVQPVSVGALAQKTLMDATTMTRNLALLKAEGLVTVGARGAKREKLVRLTAKGQKALARATPVWRDMQTRFIGTFGQRKWDDVRRDLETLAALATGRANQT
jgi:DNA-binding MarR family transcriptional regulator